MVMEHEESVARITAQADAERARQKAMLQEKLAARRKRKSQV